MSASPDAAAGIAESSRSSSAARSTVNGMDAAFSILIAVVVFLSRYWTRGVLYYVDGPRMVRAIETHTYVIQPPGYWLYCRLGALFADPAFGLTLLNELFSAAGAAVLFLLCRRFRAGVGISVLATLAYSSIFFLWFAGDVQSSYASQVLFAPLTVYCFLLYRDRPTMTRLVACALSFAIGAGLRPSDGAFLAPLFLLLLLRFVPRWKSRISLVVLTILFCLGWYIPTQRALAAAQSVRLGHQLGSLAFQVSPLLTGINARSMANVLRVVLALLAAFWILIPALAMARSRVQNWMFALWILPGVVFFALIYMADATYLTFLAGGVVLLAATVSRRRIAGVFLLICFLSNTALFLWARPIPANNRAALAVNYYVVKYCYYGIRHQWSGTIGNQ
jgi:hypothetical protein